MHSLMGSKRMQQSKKKLELLSSRWLDAVSASRKKGKVRATRTRSSDGRYLPRGDPTNDPMRRSGGCRKLSINLFRHVSQPSFNDAPAVEVTYTPAVVDDQTRCAGRKSQLLSQVAGRLYV